MYLKIPGADSVSLFSSLLAWLSGCISACVTHQPSTPGGSKIVSPLLPAVLVRGWFFPYSSNNSCGAGSYVHPWANHWPGSGRIEYADWPDLGHVGKKAAHLDWHLRRVVPQSRLRCYYQKWAWMQGKSKQGPPQQESIDRSYCELEERMCHSLWTGFLEKVVPDQSGMNECMNEEWMNESIKD